MKDESKLARWASRVGYQRYGTAGAVVAGAAAGGFVGYRFAKRRENAVGDADRDADRGAGIDGYTAAKAALDVIEGNDAGRDVADQGDRSSRDDRTGRADRTGRDDHVRPGEGTDVPVDGGDEAEE